MGQKASPLLRFMICSLFWAFEVLVPNRNLREGDMNVPSDTSLSPPPTGPVETPGLETGSDRRADVDAKMAPAAALLQQVGCDGLLLLDPDNVAWLTSGATSRGGLDPREQPGVYCNGESRWLLCSHADTPRMFEGALDRQ